MAKLKSGILFTGPLQGLSAYERRDIPGIIIRTKGGASKERIATAPEFERTRFINMETGGRSTAGSCINNIFFPLKAIKSFEFGTLNKALKPVQEMDTESLYGRRSIDISKAPGFLEGFQLNQRNALESIISSSIN